MIHSSRVMFVGEMKRHGKRRVDVMHRHHVYNESAQPNRETKTAPWHVLLSCKKEKRDEGGREILEDKGAEQERRGGRRSCLDKGPQGRKNERGNHSLFYCRISSKRQVFGPMLVLKAGQNIDKQQASER